MIYCSLWASANPPDPYAFFFCSFVFGPMPIWFVSFPIMKWLWFWFLMLHLLSFFFCVPSAWPSLRSPFRVDHAERAEIRSSWCLPLLLSPIHVFPYRRLPRGFPVIFFEWDLFSLFLFFFPFRLFPSDILTADITPHTWLFPAHHFFPSNSHMLWCNFGDKTQ